MRSTMKTSFALLLLLCLTSTAYSADLIILRNLSRIADRTVAAFNEDGVRLDNGRVVSWDAIERGRISEGQAAFDKMLSELGLPLYRIRQRLKVGDYPGVLEHAEKLYPRYAGRNSPTAYMVAQALMWGRLAQGRREEALEPYLMCYDYLRSLPPGTDLSAILPGARRLKYHLESGLSLDLTPLWFDSQMAQKTLPGVLNTIRRMKAPRPAGTRIYYGSLALAAGQDEQGAKIVQEMQTNQRLLIELREIVLSQYDIRQNRASDAADRLEPLIEDVTPENRPLALYWLGRAQTAAPQPKLAQEGALNLLHLPALYGRKRPELAAAGLYHAMQALSRQGDSAGSVAIRKELLQHYVSTHHAQLVRKQLSPSRDSEEKP